jgi:hypothetical protein
MRRLNQRAFSILANEVNRLAKDPLESVRRDIILRRLTKLQAQEGIPMTYGELKAEMEDIFPEFSDKVLRRAARANRKAGKLKLAWNVTVGLTIAAGGLWVLNLPYPMIRWPVSRTAPILLLPSYISMDHSYRQAVSLVAQSDQLVNQATSTQDIELGAEKVDEAQKHLDRLPVWFLGYYPRSYCSLFSCSWRFTYDEFAAAREEIGRMEAKVFQEQNAFTLLDEGTAEVDAAKVAYQAADTGEAKTAAVTAWQAGMDKLNEIPPETLAGRQAQTKLDAYRRDFEQVSGVLAGGNRSNSLIEAAKNFGWTASARAQNPPHTVPEWQAIADAWQQAINRLEQVTDEDPGYDEAQRMLAEYNSNLSTIQIRLAEEKASTEAWQAAQQRHTDLWGISQQITQQRYAAELQSIANTLQQVEEGTTHFQEAQNLLKSVQAQLTELANQ